MSSRGEYAGLRRRPHLWAARAAASYAAVALRGLGRRDIALARRSGALEPADLSDHVLGLTLLDGSALERLEDEQPSSGLVRI